MFRRYKDTQSIICDKQRAKSSNLIIYLVHSKMIKFIVTCFEFIQIVAS